MAAPARKLPLVSTSVVKKVRFGSSGSKVATIQYKCSKRNTHSCSFPYTRGPVHKTIFFVTLSFRMLLARSTAHVDMSCPAV